MKWINFYGIAIMVVILIPNIVFAATHKDGFENLYRNKTAEVLEQTGRFASLILMCVNIPGFAQGLYLIGQKFCILFSGSELPRFTAFAGYYFGKETAPKKRWFFLFCRRRCS